MDENGGLLNYAITNFDDPLLYQVNLLNAQNEAKNRNHKIIQNFKLTKNLSIENKFSILSHRKMYSDQFPQSWFLSEYIFRFYFNIRFPFYNFFYNRYWYNLQ